MPCVLFLTDSEKSSCGPLVSSPFIYYNKSKELCEKHAKKVYHLREIDRAYGFKVTYSDASKRIDNQIADICSFKL